MPFQVEKGIPEEPSASTKRADTGEIIKADSEESMTEEEDQRRHRIEASVMLSKQSSDELPLGNSGSDLLILNKDIASDVNVALIEHHSPICRNFSEFGSGR